MKNYERLRGMVSATFTPMYEDGSLNLEIIASMPTILRLPESLEYSSVALPAIHFRLQ